jgi:hypothetical protein
VGGLVEPEPNGIRGSDGKIYKGRSPKRLQSQDSENRPNTLLNLKWDHLKRTQAGGRYRTNADLHRSANDQVKQLKDFQLSNLDLTLTQQMNKPREMLEYVNVVVGGDSGTGTPQSMHKVSSHALFTPTNIAFGATTGQMEFVLQ